MMTGLRSGWLAVPVLCFVLSGAPGSPLAATHGEDGHGYRPGHSHTGNYLAGRHAQAVRDLDAATVYLRAVLTGNDLSDDILYRAFLVLLADGRVSEAIPLAHRFVDTQGTKGRAELAHLTLAVAAFAEQDYAAVEARLDRLVAGSGTSHLFRPLFGAWSTAGRGDTDGALAALAPLGLHAGGGALHDIHAALLKAHGGRPEQAADDLVKMMESPGGFRQRTVALLGAVHRAAGDPQNAEAVYRSFLERHPDARPIRASLARLRANAADGDGPDTAMVRSIADGVAEALFDVAGSFDRQNVTETALILAQLANHLRPDFPPSQLMTATLLERLYGARRANRAYARVARNSGYAWSADLRRADNLGALGEVEAAETLFRTLARQDAASPEPLIDLGDLLRGEGRFEDAVATYDEAFARIGGSEEQYWSLHYARGIALERAMQWDRAEADFLQALEYEPDQPLVLNYLGYSWIDSGKNLNRALEMIHRAVDQRPNDGYIIDSLGWAYFKLGRWDDAVRELDRAVERRPEEPIINDHLGDAFWKVGRYREARFQWKRALNLDPDDATAATIRRKLDKGLNAGTDSGNAP